MVLGLADEQSVSFSSDILVFGGVREGAAGDGWLDWRLNWAYR